MSCFHIAIKLLLLTVMSWALAQDTTNIPEDMVTQYMAPGDLETQTQPSGDMVTQNQPPVEAKPSRLPPNLLGPPKYQTSEKWRQLSLVSYVVRKYVAVIVLPISLTLNFFTMIIFMQPKQRKQSASFLMTGIAMADMLAVALDWNLMIKEFTFFNLDSYGHFCEFILYITYVSRSLSSWYIFLFTVERFISVKFPLKKSIIVTRKRVLLALAITTVLVCVAQSYFIVFFRNYNIGCNVTRKYSKIFKKIKFVFREILGFIIPSLLTASLNGVIIRTLRNWAKKQPNLKGLKTNDKEKDNSTLTFMLITVSTFSIVVYCPRSISQMYFDTLGRMSYKEITMDIFLECFAILNHSCNFILYCLSGKTFREEFLMIISCYHCEYLLKLLFHNHVKTLVIYQCVFISADTPTSYLRNASHATRSNVYALTQKNGAKEDANRTSA